MGQPLCDLSCETRDTKRPLRGGEKNARMFVPCSSVRMGGRGEGREREREGERGRGREGELDLHSSEPERGVCVRLRVLYFRAVTIAMYSGL